MVFLWVSQVIGVPQIIQVMDDHFSIETYGDLGIFFRLSSEVMIELAMRIDPTRKMTLWLGLINVRCQVPQKMFTNGLMMDIWN